MYIEALYLIDETTTNLIDTTIVQTTINLINATTAQTTTQFQQGLSVYIL
jgi:hypothetical protein